MKGVIAFIVCLLFLNIQVISTQQNDWIIEKDFRGYNLFDNFLFFHESDPTHGYVYYTTREEAWSFGYVNVTENNQAYLGCDHESIATGAGRGSVRIHSAQVWQHGLFIADFAHMPQGCGTWPAYWMVGPDWPNYGEIDIIEGVNLLTQDQTTLHTQTGCVMPNTTDEFTGTLLQLNCSSAANGNAGCGILCDENNSYGAGFNNNNGGVYVLQWLNTSISTWFFERNSIPFDITSNSPDPSKWGTPYAHFPLGDNCPASFFRDLSIVINLTFCGDWAGNVFSQTCAYYEGDCQSFVQNNPAAFTEAYWLINYIQVYQLAGN